MENKGVYEKIRDDEYRTKLEYPIRRTDLEGHRAYRADQSRLLNQFKTDALVELKLLELGSDGSTLFKHTKADLLWEKAWDRGHHSGLSEVWNELQDLSELITG